MKTRQYLPYDRFFIEEIENWINVKSREGLKLTSIGPFRAEFKEDDSRLTYRIDAGHRKIRPLIEEDGWKFVCPYRRNLAVYASSAKNPKDPGENDRLTQAITSAFLKEEGRSLMGGLWIPLIFLLLLCLVIAYHFRSETMMLLDDRILTSMICLTGLTLLSLFRTVRHIRAVRRWKSHRLRKKTDDFYEKLRVRKDKDRPLKDKCLKPMIVIAAALLLLLLLPLLVRGLTHRRSSLADASYSYLTLTELEGQEVLPYDVDNYPNDITRDYAFFVPKQITIRQAGLIPAPEEEASEEAVPDDPYTLEDNPYENVWEQVSMSTTIYKTISVRTAENLFRSLEAFKLHWNDLIKVQTLEVEGADEAVYAGYQSMQYLLLRKGRTLCLVFYLGDINLNEAAENFVPSLN